MDIPNESHPAWMRIISEQVSPEFKCLATKVLVGRLKLKFRIKPTPDTGQECVADLYSFFKKHQKIPKVLNDLNEILNRRIQP